MARMTIERAHPDDVTEARAFYHALIDAHAGSQIDIGWEKDVYPTPAMLTDAAEAGELVIGREAGDVVASMILNHEGNEGYRQARWPQELTPAQYLVIHALGVSAAQSGRGLGADMVDWAIEEARRESSRAIRLDVLQGNGPAVRLYTRLGFQLADTARMFYEDTGWTDYDLYELPL